MKNEWVDEDQITRLLVYPLFAPQEGAGSPIWFRGVLGGYRGSIESIGSIAMLCHRIGCYRMLYDAIGSGHEVYSDVMSCL